MARYGRKIFQPASTSQSPRMGDLTVGDYANGMPNIRLGEMFKSFLRQLPWVGILFAIGAAIAWVQTADFKRSFFGNGSILVQFSDDYAYNPVGQTGQTAGLNQTIDTITLTEAAIMKNGDIIDYVIGEIGAAVIAPEAWQKVEDARSSRDPNDEAIARMELRTEVGDAYVVMPRAKSSVIDVRFEHVDPSVAVAATNHFIDEYIEFRRRVFVEGKDEIISERREATESQLKSNERAIARFLQKNDISDFTSEQEGLQERTEALKAALNETRASISETEGALAKVEDQLRGTAETINLFRDDISAQRVAQAELELRQLLARYLPTSDPVRQKQTELDELRSLQSSYGGKASGGRRVGPNPTYQTLEEQRNNLASTADSLREREFTLQRQLNSADAKIRRLTSLSPEYQNLLRERETLDTRLASYNAKEQEALVDALQAADQAENVKVVSYAKYPSKGRNMRILMFVIASLAWGLILFFIAMTRVFLDPRLYATPATRRRASDLEAPADGMPDAVAAPISDPIPEPIPAYSPGVSIPPNPYEIPAAASYTDGSGYSATHGYVETTGYSDPAYGAMPQVQGQESYSVQSAGEAYAPTSAGVDQFGRPLSTPYQPPNTEHLPSYDQGATTYVEGNTALDLSHNPYASGEAIAGSFQDQPQQTGYVDQYGNPVPLPPQ